MPNYLKALILVLIATSVVLYFVRDPVISHYSKKEYREYRNMWWFITACLFISPDIWILYAIVFVALLTRRYAADIDRVSAYLFLLFTAPSIEASIPGIGGINRFFDLDLQRILVLVVLLPIFKKSLKGGFSVVPSDKFVVLYLGMIAILLFRQDSVTHSIRQAVVLGIDFFIPYFVVSRTISSLSEFNRVLLALMFTFAMLSAEAIMESLRHWELYNSVGQRLIGERVFRFSGERAGILRARSIFLSPIILGFAMVFLLALLVYMKPYFTRKFGFYVLFGLGGMALVFTFSRAAWVGGVVMLAVYIMAANGVAKAAWYLVAGALTGFVALTMTQFGQSMLKLLPFFGGTERLDTFDYRARLMENGIILVKRNPWFGDHLYLMTPEMEELRQGQGIIDTVNGFLAVAMRYGLVTLFFFLMIFIPSIFIIFRRIRGLPPSEARFGDLGRMLISFMVASLLIISTVSNTDFVPVLSFIGAAFMAAWIRISNDLENRSRRTEIVVR